MAQHYFVGGLLFCFISGYVTGRVKPIREAREWATWYLGGHGPQSRGRTCLALLLVPDKWSTIREMRRFRRLVQRSWAAECERAASDGR